MNRNADKPDQQQDKGMLEKIADVIDPPGREISDDELIDPGKNIPDARPNPVQPHHHSGGTK
jgi:hypothetical protein